MLKCFKQVINVIKMSTLHYCVLLPAGTSHSHANIRFTLDLRLQFPVSTSRFLIDLEIKNLYLVISQKVF